jgi:predicted nuclease of predicted toxin-antitoxin system
VKLLLDQNLSPRLVDALSDICPEIEHVQEADLATADDDTIWAYARQHDLMIVSKDSDFHQRSLVFGAPPKVAWLRLGNCTTRDVERLLRSQRARLSSFYFAPEGSFLVLSRDD